MFVINIAGLLFLLAVNTLPGKMTHGYNIPDIAIILGIGLLAWLC